jgi:ABC-type multidrug transport system fused ATPase/permease subunit
MTPNTPTTAFRLLVSTLRPHLRALGAIGVLSALMVAATVALPLLIGGAIDAITLGRRGAALVTAGAIAVLGIVLAVVMAARGIGASRLSLTVERTLRTRLYSHLHELDPPTLDGRSTGEWVSLATLDLIPIANFVGLYLAQLVTAALTLLAAAVVMFTIDPLLALLALAPAPLSVVAVARYRATARPILNSMRQRMAELTGLVDENIGGAAMIRASGREDEEMRRFREAGSRVMDEALAANRRLAVFTPIIQVVPSLGAALVVIVGGLMAIQGDLSVVSFAVFYTYLVMLVPSLQTIGTVIGQAQDALACAERVSDVLCYPSEGGPPEPSVGDSPAAVDLDGGRVSADDGRTIIDGAEVHAPPGGRVGIVGATGSGKSTLVRVLNRLIRPSAGAVRVEGLAVDEVEIHSLRHAIGTAGADEFLFAGTIAENIAFGRPDATQEDIEAAARCAQAHDFIAALPDGYATRLGDRGAGLSGGQRQRIAVARALTARPGVLVLDNATGSLDAVTEAATAQALGRHRQDDPPTRLVVSYRPALLRDADEVVVIEDGRIVERGAHDELLRTSERYRGLVGS